MALGCEAVTLLAPLLAPLGYTKVLLRAPAGPTCAGDHADIQYFNALPAPLALSPTGVRLTARAALQYYMLLCTSTSALVFLYLVRPRHLLLCISILLYVPIRPSPVAPAYVLLCTRYPGYGCCTGTVALRYPRALNLFKWGGGEARRTRYLTVLRCKEKNNPVLNQVLWCIKYIV